MASGLHWDRYSIQLRTVFSSGEERVKLLASE